MTTGIDRVLDDARRQLGWRPTPAELDDAVAAGAVVVDIRPIEQRSRDGDLPGALVIDRNVLEWRIDPTDRVVIVVCNEGYSSSLAALSLRQIGVTRATDLDGGYQAWVTWRHQPRSIHS